MSEKDPIMLYGNTTDYEVDFNKLSIQDVNSSIVNYYKDYNDLKQQIEYLTYNQTTFGLEDSTYVLLSGDTAFVVNYSDNIGATLLFQYNNMDIDKFPCINNETNDTLCEKLYLYYYKSDI